MLEGVIYLNTTKCPYCKSCIKYTDALINRKSGEYICKKCQKICDIYYTSKLQIFTLIFAVIILLVGVLFILFLKHTSVWESIAVLAIYGIYYFTVPLFLRLAPYNLGEKYRLKD